jgi:hypothetical protein
MSVLGTNWRFLTTSARSASLVRRKTRWIRKPPFYPLNYGNNEIFDSRFSIADWKQYAAPPARAAIGKIRCIVRTFTRASPAYALYGEAGANWRESKKRALRKQAESRRFLNRHALDFILAFIRVIRGLNVFDCGEAAPCNLRLGLARCAIQRISVISRLRLGTSSLRKTA